MPTVGRIAPSARAEPIEQDYGAVRAQLIGDPLHQHGLAHAAGSMHDERRTSLSLIGRLRERIEGKT